MLPTCTSKPFLPDLFSISVSMSQNTFHLPSLLINNNTGFRDHRRGAATRQPPRALRSPGAAMLSCTSLLCNACSTSHSCLMHHLITSIACETAVHFCSNKHRSPSATCVCHVTNTWTCVAYSDKALTLRAAHQGCVHQRVSLACVLLSCT